MFAALLPLLGFTPRQQPLPYQIATVPVERRVEDLLRRMTPREKINQLGMLGTEGLSVKDGRVPEADVQKLFGNDSIGMLHADFNADAATNVIKFKAASDYLAHHTRLGIPALSSSEAIHGLLMAGATTYPQAMGMGATWNPSLEKEVAGQIAQEASACGVSIILSPVLDLARDPRYGRVEECFSECPALTAAMGVAYITGAQGDDYRTGLGREKVLCQIKHFAGYSVPYNGINIGPSSIGPRDMRSLHLVSFEAAIKKAHAASVMPSYNEVDGIPSHANEWLLTQVLRREWGFEGFVGSDWGGVDFNADLHGVSPDRYKGRTALQAGVDLEEPELSGFKNFPELIAKRELDVKYIDQAVRRVLLAKFRAGLFDSRRAIEGVQVLHTPEHVALARRAAEESVILLKNKGGLLPLRPESLKSIAVIGPNADQVEFGDYSWTKNNRDGITVLHGLRDALAGKATLNYAKGCDLVGLSKDGFAAAVEAAQKSDVAVVVIGDTSMTLSGVGWGDPTVPAMGTVGEGFDVSNPVPGVQEELVEAVAATGKPLVVVMLQGRTFCIPWIKEHADAILSCYYPGEEEGHAIADVLLGKVNPSGRLPVSVAQSAGHIPTVYDYKPSGRGYYHQPGTPEKPGRDYVFSSPDPLWPFGFGLSYTTFAYSDLQVAATPAGIRCQFKVTNSGSREGKEVAQVYYREQVASVTTPVKRLIRFKKVSLAVGQSVQVAFDIPKSELEVWNPTMQRVFEPGVFDVMVGKNADDIVLKGSVPLGRPRS